LGFVKKKNETKRKGLNNEGEARSKKGKGPERRKAWEEEEAPTGEKATHRKCVSVEVFPCIARWCA
jgi:hypothetical protein